MARPAVAPVLVSSPSCRSRFPGPDRSFGTLWEQAHEPKLWTALEFVWKMALPNAMPDVFAGIRLALTVSLILAVVMEMLSGLIGLGHNIMMAARAFRSADLYAGIIVLGALGYLANAGLERLEAHVLRWRST